MRVAINYKNGRTSRRLCLPSDKPFCDTYLRAWSDVFNFFFFWQSKGNK